MAPPTYIISRVADPIFAVAIGLSATVTRINREEKEKGRTTEQTIEAAKRYKPTTLLLKTFFCYGITLIILLADGSEQLSPFQNHLKKQETPLYSAFML